MNKKVPGVARLKTTFSAPSVQHPVAPPVYRPQPVPRVLQTKSTCDRKLVSQTGRAPVGPARDSQFKPKVAQTKTAVASPLTVQRSVVPKGRVAHNLFPPVIQRAEDIKKRKEQFAEKRKLMQNVEARYSEWNPDVKSYPGQASLDEIAAEAFSSLSSQATGAVAWIDNKLYFAGQGGMASANLLTIRGAFPFITCEAADVSIPAPNMHAEMIIIYYCLKRGINPKNAAIGVKDKGCCRLCSAVLSYFDIAYTRTERSQYEDMWVDPWIMAGQKSPFGEGSGVPREQSKLL